MSHDFANILFAGPCNRRCPFCIGKQLPDRANVDNLDAYPPRGLDAFVDAVNRERIRDVVFTGTTTDPQLYRHEARLLRHLRRVLHGGVRFALHTNGALALAKMDVFDLYDRPCVSLPSIDPDTYARMMGSRHVPDLAAIVRRSRRPVKVSCLVNDENRRELRGFLEECRRIGVHRVVLRQEDGRERPWMPIEGLWRTGRFRGNDVYDFLGMEVTLWRFDRAELRSLNLFADGTLGTSYRLTETPELAPRAAAERVPVR